MDKKIDIPFGAKDSELKGWEYTIPEGMEAVIKDGKVIVKEKESEDERIIREIKQFILDNIGEISVDDPEYPWLAWLEKQKESLHILETCKENADSFTNEDERIRKELVAFFIEVRNREGNEGYWHDLKVADILAYLEKQKEEEGYEAIPVESTLEYKLGFKAGKESEKQKEHTTERIEQIRKDLYQSGYNDGYQHGREDEHIEQKPVEWSEDIIRKAVKEVGLTQHQIDWFKTNVFPPKQEWSKEDDKIRRNLMSLLSCMRGDRIAEDTYRKYYPWLRDLPKRFNLQQPAEWSEEDEEMRDCCIVALSNWRDAVEKYGHEKEPCQRLIDWLKSLRPQSKEELAKMLEDEYNKGKEYGERIGHTKGYNKGYKDAEESVSYHFPYSGCDGIHCTNPQMDCINCPRKFTGGMFNTSSSSGEPTLKADWKPSEEQMEALKRASTNEYLPAKQFDILVSLYEQLKKLM